MSIQWHMSLGERDEDGRGLGTLLWMEGEDESDVKLGKVVGGELGTLVCVG